MSFSGNNMTGDELSDSENEDPEDAANNAAIRIDDWISFKADTVLIHTLVQLRQKWSAMFLRRLKTPGKPVTQENCRKLSGSSLILI